MDYLISCFLHILYYCSIERYRPGFYTLEMKQTGMMLGNSPRDRVESLVGIN